MCLRELQGPGRHNQHQQQQRDPYVSSAQCMTGTRNHIYCNTQMSLSLTATLCNNHSLQLQHVGIRKKVYGRTCNVRCLYE